MNVVMNSSGSKNDHSVVLLIPLDITGQALQALQESFRYLNKLRVLGKLDHCLDQGFTASCCAEDGRGV
jgi:hypothetical protein